MKLHRAQAKPDWFGLSKYNFWQKIAHKTNGIVTPGNAISIIGFLLVLVGVYYLFNAEYVWTFWLVLAGRICDLLDGLAADLTQTKSSLGELVDVVIDKLATIVIVTAIIIINLINWWLVVLLVVPQLLIVVNSFHKKRKKIKVQPSLYGKISMALLWLSVIGLICTRLVPLQGVELVQIFSYSTAIASSTLALVALGEYRRLK